MQFRCYTCKFLLHDGMPPVEALSQQQIGMVGGNVPEVERFDALEGTPYEGMSVYQFCAFCLHIITEYPSRTAASCEIAWSTSRDWAAAIQWQGVQCQTHGELFRVTIDTNKGESFRRFDYTLRARHTMLHKVEQVYRKADLTFARQLLEMEA